VLRQENQMMLLREVDEFDIKIAIIRLISRYLNRCAQKYLNLKLATLLW